MLLGLNNFIQTSELGLINQKMASSEQQEARSK